MPVGSTRAMSRFGTFDMAGNVKEWCWNAAGPERYLLGGAWNEPSYTFMDRDATDPFQRLSTYGFRLVREVDAVDPRARAAIERTYRDYERETPVSDEVYESFRSFYAFDPDALDPEVQALDSGTDSWTLERVTFNGAPGDDQVPSYLYLPTNAEPPYSVVMFFPGTGALFSRNHEDQLAWVDFIVRSGRAVLVPIFNGTFERINNAGQLGRNEQRTLVIQWAREVSRSIDYLETRPDINTERLAFYGFSLGARFGPIFVALEDRFAASILVAGGLNQYVSYPSVLPTTPETDPFNFASHVATPVLMVNGRHDFARPLEISQLPLYEMLSTPAEHKYHELSESGHVPPLLDVIRHTLDFLDSYLGPVN